MRSGSVFSGRAACSFEMIAFFGGAVFESSKWSFGFACDARGPINEKRPRPSRTQHHPGTHETCDRSIDVERCLAIRALAREPLADALPALRTSRVDVDEDIRYDAVSVIAEFADSSTASDLLESLIEDPSLDAKTAAIDGLGRIRARDAVDILCQLAVEPTANIAWDGEEFAQGETDGWLELQRLAIKALGQIGDPKAIEPIVAATYDEFSQDLWPESLDALMGLGRPARRL